MRVAPAIHGPASAFVVALLAASAPAAAETRDLEVDPATDATIFVAGGAAWIASELLKPTLGAKTCLWCNVDGFDLDVRNALVWGNTSVADTASGVIAFGVAPLTAFVTLALASNHEGAYCKDFWSDALIVGEATVLAMDFNQITKYVARRERPFVYELSPSQKSKTPEPDDNNLSFFSGHTTATFALAAAAGTVATMRGYRWAPLTWIAGGVLAFGTGYLRMAADKHWFTDVATGMVFGTASGILIPYALHRPKAAGVDTSPAMWLSPWPGGASLTVVW